MQPAGLLLLFSLLLVTIHQGCSAEATQKPASGMESGMKEKESIVDRANVSSSRLTTSEDEMNNVSRNYDHAAEVSTELFGTNQDASFVAQNVSIKNPDTNWTREPPESPESLISVLLGSAISQKPPSPLSEWTFLDRIAETAAKAIDMTDQWSVNSTVHKSKQNVTGNVQSSLSGRLSSDAEVKLENASVVPAPALSSSETLGLSPLLSLIRTGARLTSFARMFLPQELQRFVSPVMRLVEAVTKIYTSEYETSLTCLAHRNAVGVGVTSGNMWALQFVDTMGKIPSGLLLGNTLFLGRYHECASIHGLTDQGDSIRAKHVYFRFKVPPLHGIPSTNDFKATQVSGLPFIHWTLCLPESCSDTDVRSIGRQFSVYTGLKLDVSRIVQRRNPAGDHAFILAVSTTVCLALCCVVGTYIDFLQHSLPVPKDAPEARVPVKKSEIGVSRPSTDLPSCLAPISEGSLPSVSIPLERPELNHKKAGSSALTSGHGKHMNDNGIGHVGRALLAFSIKANMAQVLKAQHEPGEITCLHGMRVISISWVILGHVYYFAPQSGNLMFFAEQTKKLSFEAIINASYAVDTFFVLSGCLVAYLFLKGVNKEGGLRPRHMLLYYVHRYLRLTPLYGLMILLYTGVLPYLLDGPMAEETLALNNVCRDTWWMNLLYISNFLGLSKMCMIWSWYLPNEMQFYVLAPLVLIPWVWGRKATGLVMATLMFSCHIVSVAVLQRLGHLDPFRDFNEYFDDIYNKPYSRCAPYALGLLLGILLHETKCTFRLRKTLVLCGWVTSICVGMTAVFLFYDDIGENFMQPRWSQGTRDAFFVVNRPLWALSVTWVIFACATGQGGPINSLLSWNAWIPLSRLTFGTYLGHVMVMFYFNGNQQVAQHMDTNLAVQLFLSNLVLSFCLSFVVSLLIETPVRNLIKRKNK